MIYQIATGKVLKTKINDIHFNELVIFYIFAKMFSLNSNF